MQPPPKNGLFSKIWLKDRAYLVSASRNEWGGEKAKLQRKREKEKKNHKKKVHADDLQQ
jgi:hypothetical protein